VVAINDDASPADRCNDRSRQGENVVTDPAKFRKYFHDVLGHLSREDKGVMEPVLSRYSHVFTLEENIPLKGTDLVEHQIVTGDATPIRKAPYWVPFALRRDMKTQMKDMLKKGSIELSQSPWGVPALLVPKKSLDGKPKYLFFVDIRALNKITMFDSYPLPVFDETVSTFMGAATSRS
jgi:hypothetical protein